MLVDHFPLLGLRLRTPRLELRLPSPEELGALADVAVDGLHSPDTQPFLTPWTQQPPAEVARKVIQDHWRSLGAWSPRDWTLNFAVFHGETVIGRQSIGARDLSITQEVRTGSWLGQRHHGHGYGTEMRAAVLHLAFAGLNAEEAFSAAFEHNEASLAVSRKLGYRPDGTERQVVRDELAIDRRMRLTREAWHHNKTTEVTIDGLDPCRPLLGIDPL
ncbi:GNAT family N-acetyltransferase [Actinocrispum wychmicini]|uniref:RimJ/RimL family protein N-acetyltransferase n=1 Tax=Actinocrispum wychmicini TaxID=1213861 RepID=A0A4R2JG43_9PSEU|nr:GNAT family N-acetyltransferase [Actinocrispum wychmicini]TCO58743.1 RimJ/RimL family protein N-acetyltransferase [Actinocrispum wychmicini]